MRKNPNYILSDVADSHILVPVGKSATSFHSIITLNEMGQTIWNMLEKETTTNEILQNILAEYDVSEEQAKNDIDFFITGLREKGCIED